MGSKKSQQRATHTAFQTILRQAHPDGNLRDELPSKVFHLSRSSDVSPRFISCPQDWVGIQHSNWRVQLFPLPRIPELQRQGQNTIKAHYVMSQRDISF